MYTAYSPIRISYYKDKTIVNASFIRGIISTENETDINGNEHPVNRFRGKSRVKMKIFTFDEALTREQVEEKMKVELPEVAQGAGNLPLPSQL